MSDNDHVIDFRPEPGFTIEKLARNIVQMMKDLEMDAQITLPDGVVIELEQGVTVKEIVTGYKEFIANKIKSRQPSNKNDKKER